MHSYQWTSVKNKPKPKRCAMFEVTNHPLKLVKFNMIEPRDSMLINSLNRLNAAFDNEDPLLRFVRQEEHLDIEKNTTIMATQDVDFVKVWRSKKSQILHRYTTGEKLSIVSSFLPGGEKLKEYTNLNDQVKHRLEQLDEFDESTKKTIGLSQQEYIIKINTLNEELKKAWIEEERVKAFKIAIQSSKLLSDTSVMQFYPSKFVLISDILDTFGDLVFNRLKEKSYEHSKIKLSDNIDPDVVPEAAKETCLNWLYKMASIRELIPRLYIEMALLRCYTFLSTNEYDIAIKRLIEMIRGIGNPLVSLYLRLYLSRVAVKLSKDSQCFDSNIEEFLLIYDEIFSTRSKRDYELQSLNLETYVSLYFPGIDWLFCGALNSSPSNSILLDKYLKWCKENPQHNELLLCCIMSSFDCNAIASQALFILEIIQNKTDSSPAVLTHEILFSLGEHLCKADRTRHLTAEILIQTWWKIVNNMKSLQHFLRVLEPWLEFGSSYLTTKHVNFILRGIIRFMVKCGRPVDECQNSLQSSIKRMIKSVPDVEEIFIMDAFMPVVELVQTLNAQTNMAKMILIVFFDKFNAGSRITDHIVINSLKRLCSVLHDGITAVTVDDEVKLIADLISKFIQCVDFPDDDEQQLSFYVECRASFIKLEAVLVTLVYAVNALSVRSGKDSAENSFQRACSAYCYATVPSLHCPLMKAQLYLLSGQVALLNNCIGQAEAFFKILITQLPNIPTKQIEDGQMKCTQIKVAAVISDFLSTLLIVPDNVDTNCKAVILNRFLGSIEKMQWQQTDPVYYSTLLQSLDLLQNMYQENYSYHIKEVISNDMLYGCDEEFVMALDRYSSNLCEQLLSILKLLGDQKQPQKQHELSLLFFWRVIKRSSLDSKAMNTLAANLFLLSQKICSTDNKFAITLLSSLPTEGLLYQQLSKHHNFKHT